MMIPNPCFDAKTKRDCKDRHAGCSVNCLKWKRYCEKRNTNYEISFYESMHKQHMVDRTYRMKKYHGPGRHVEHN